MSRDSHLDKVPSFVEFHLLKGPEAEDQHSLCFSHRLRKQCSRNSSTFKLSRVERLKRVNIANGLRLLIPFEIAKRYIFGCEIHKEKPIFLDGRNRFLHV